MNKLSDLIGKTVSIEIRGFDDTKEGTLLNIDNGGYFLKSTDDDDNTVYLFIPEANNVQMVSYTKG